MSKEIDTRVVQMKFDNSNFEKNTRQTMSMLDKLKSALHFGKEKESFSEINDEAKRVNLSPISQGVEKVQASFSALQVVAFTIIQDITRTAEAYGKRIASALTIDPVKSGFQEYETQINAVQTILANTSSKGTTLDQVNDALAELNTYADKTIYNFTEMTRNIGTFTAAGVDLDTSVQAIKGIANLAAVSGSTSQQASTAMYQLSQALAAGTVKLMDWNSVVNAGMGGQIFQDSLKETARAHGIAIDDMIKKEGSFRETLQEGWLTSQILTETLAKFTGDLSESQLRSQGYTEDQINEIKKLGVMSNDAATKVKTFTQLVDTLKESAQSGWTQTWELIIGDFEQAKDLFTKISDTIGGMISDSADARNAMVHQALDSKWDQFEQQINAAGISTESYKNELSKTVKANGKNLDALIKKYGSLGKAMSAGAFSSDEIRKAFKTISTSALDASKNVDVSEEKLKKFQKVVNDVWRGDYKNGEERVKALTAANYDYNEVQTLVNKTVDGHKLTLKDLSDAQLKNIGYTKEEVEAIRLLALQAEDANMPFSRLMDNMSAKSGRELLVDTVNTALETFKNLVGSVKDAWRQIFPANSGNIIYDAIKAINTFVNKLKIGDKDTEKYKQLVTIFKALFTIVHAVTNIVGGGFKAVWYVVKRVLGVFNLDVLDLLEMLSNGILYISDWIKEWGIFTKTLEPVCKLFEWLFTLIANLTVKNQAFMNGLKKIGDLFKPITEAFSKWIDGFQSAENIGQYLVEGLVNGIAGGLKLVFDIIVELANMVIQTLVGMWSIHSPSKETYELGYYLVVGLVNGIKDSTKMLGDALFEAGKNIMENFKNGISSVWKTIGPYVKNIVGSTVQGISNLLSGINWDTVLGGAKLAVGGLIGFKSLGILENLTDTLDSFGELAEGLGVLAKKIGSFFAQVGDAFQQFAKGVKIKFIGEAVKDFAISVLILVGAIWLLTMIDADRLWAAVGAVTVLVACVAGLITAVSLLSKFTGGAKSMASITAVILSIGITLGILAIAIHSLGSMDDDDLTKGIAAVSSLFLEIGLLILAASKIQNGIKGVASTLIATAICMWLMLRVAKSAAKIPEEDLVKGLIVIKIFQSIIKGLVKKLGSVKRIKGVASTILATSFAMILMGLCIKIIAPMSIVDLAKGVIVIALFGKIIENMVKSLGDMKSKQAINNAQKVILKVGVAMLLLGLATRIIGTMSIVSLAKGVGAIAIFGLIIQGLIKSTEKSGKHAAKAGVTILLVSGAMLLLTGVAYLLSFMSIEDLAKGITAVSILGLIISIMMKSARGVRKLTGTIVAMTVAIGVLVGAVWLLSTINSESLYSAVGALSIVLLIFALLLKVASGDNKTAAKDSFVVLATLTGIVVVIASILAYLSSLKYNTSMLEIAESISLVLLALTASMFIISKIGNVTIDKDVLTTFAVLSGILVVIALALNYANQSGIATSIKTAAALSILLFTLTGCIGIISKIHGKIDSKVVGYFAILGLVFGELALALGLAESMNIQNGIKNSVALSILLGSLTACIFLLSKIPKVESSVIVSMVALSAVLFILAGVFKILSDFNVAPAIETAISLGILINALAVALIPLGAAGEFQIPAVMTGVLGLTALIFALAMVLGAIGGITNMMGEGGIEAFKTSVEVMGYIGQALGDFIGNFVGGIIGGIGKTLIDILPDLGDSLGKFGDNAQPFFTAINALPENFSSKIGWLVVGLLGLTVAELLEGIPKIMSRGQVSLAAFGYELSLFAKNAGDFFAAIKSLNIKDMLCMKYLSEALLTITAAELLNGIASFFGMGQSMSLKKFGTDLSDFGDGVAAFGEKIKGKLDPKDVVSACLAGEIMAGLYNKLPREGGWMQGLFGEAMSLSTFGTQLKDFGDAIVIFSETVSGKIDNEAVKAASEAGATIATLYEKLPKTGGWMQNIFGESTDLDEFGRQLEGFGNSIVKFNNVEGIDKINQEVVENACKAGERIAKLQESIPTSGGIWELFGGKHDFTQFNSDLEGFGTAVAKFHESIKEIEFNEKTMKTIEGIGPMMKTLYEIAPNEGGIWGALSKAFGGGGKEEYDDQGKLISKTSKDWSTFEHDLEGFAGAVAKFSDVLYKDTEGKYTIAQATLDNFVNGATGLVDLVSKVHKLAPNGFWESASALFGGDNTGADQFKTGLVHLAEAISSLNSVITAEDYKINETALTSFETNITNLGDFMVKKLPDIKTEKADHFKDFVNKLKDADLDGLMTTFKDKDFDGFGTSIANSIGAAFGDEGTMKSLDSNMETFVNRITRRILEGTKNAFSDKEQTTEAEKAVKTFFNAVLNPFHEEVKKVGDISRQYVTDFAKGIKSKESMSTIDYAFSNYRKNGIFDHASEYMNSNAVKQRFVTAGENVIAGLVDGMTGKINNVDSASEQIAKALLKKTCDLLGIHSPSREFMKIGKFSMMGLANGIRNNIDLITKSSEDAGKTALETVNDYCYQIANHIDDDFNPRIKPVLDLTDIVNGSKQLPSIFNGVGIDTNMQARIVASELSYRGVPNQNGTTNEMASEIKMLREDMYNIVDAISGLEMRMDSGELVGAIAKPMDSALGARARMLRRS